MKDYKTFFTSLSNRSVIVIGFGISNKPLVSLLLQYGAQVTVCDKRSFDQLDPSAEQYQQNGVKFVCGENYLDSLDADLIFRTPGLLPTEEHLKKALDSGAVVTSEMECFYELCPYHTIGITGSDGKTTTSTLISEILKRSGKRVWLGGNIGTPLLSKIPEMTPDDFCVTELSSFQLMDMKCSPDIAVVTNLSPNHLDKHGSMQEYIDAKKNIFLHQNPNGVLVINADNAVTKEFWSEAKGEVRYFSRSHSVSNGIFYADGFLVRSKDGTEEKLFPASDIMIPGMHNVENYMTAAAAVWDYCRTSDVHSVAKEFKGVEHRLEFVKTVNGVRYYNSSIDSSPSRTAAALSVFQQKLTVIVGGSDKHISFDSLGELLCQKADRVILAGYTGPMIADAIRKAASYLPGKPEIIDAKTVENAVAQAHSLCREGEIVLLSPACASFDAFKNFEERGRVFKNSVLSL